MREQRPVAVAVVVQTGRLLLIRRSAPEGNLLWVLPGGGVEQGETPEGAAVREALEETGLTVEAVKLLGERVHPDTGRPIVYVACSVLEGTAHAASPREVSAVVWAAFNEIPDYVPRGLHEPVQAHLERWNRRTGRSESFASRQHPAAPP